MLSEYPSVPSQSALEAHLGNSYEAAQNNRVTFGSVIAGLGYAAQRLSRQVWLWHKKQASRRQLARLTHEQLEDIGKTEGEASNESSQPFWK